MRKKFMVKASEGEGIKTAKNIKIRLKILLEQPKDMLKDF
jgi:hypothetical protein